MDNLWGAKLPVRFTRYDISLLRYSYKLSRTIPILCIKSHTFDSPPLLHSGGLTKRPIYRFIDFGHPYTISFFPSEKDMVSFFPRCPGAVPSHPMSVCPPHILMHFLESASFSCVWITPNPMLFSSLLSFPASENPLLLLRLFFSPYRSLIPSIPIRTLSLDFFLFCSFFFISLFQLCELCEVGFRANRES